MPKLYRNLSRSRIGKILIQAPFYLALLINLGCGIGQRDITGKEPYYSAGSHMAAGAVAGAGTGALIAKTMLANGNIGTSTLAGAAIGIPVGGAIWLAHDLAIQAEFDKNEELIKNREALIEERELALRKISVEKEKGLEKTNEEINRLLEGVQLEMPYMGVRVR